MKIINVSRWVYYLIAIVLIVFFITPIFFMFLVSISSNPDFLAENVDFQITIRNFIEILTRQNLYFKNYLFNSIVVALITTIICTLVASLAAYAITRLNIRYAEFILYFILATSMFPQISIVGFLFKLMSKLGWINTYQGLILPYVAWSLPLSLWILTSYFSKIPKDLDKAGIIDGCSYWQVLYKIILPVSAPGILSTALLVFIFSFNEFMFALMLTTDYKARTVPVGIALFEGLHGQIPWGLIMSASFISVFPLILLTIIFQKHIIQGLTRGAIKG